MMYVLFIFQRTICKISYCFICYLLKIEILILLEVLGEQGIITRLIRIIRAGTTLVSNSFNLSWNPKCIDFLFWFPTQVEGITDERGLF